MQRFTLKDQFRRGVRRRRAGCKSFCTGSSRSFLSSLTFENYFYLVIRQVVNTEYYLIDFFLDLFRRVRLCREHQAFKFFILLGRDAGELQLHKIAAKHFDLTKQDLVDKRVSRASKESSGMFGIRMFALLSTSAPLLSAAKTR